MRLSPTLAALALLAAASTPALAQGFPCLENLSKLPGRTPPPDHYSSATWLQLPRFPDPAILPLIVGTWYTENQSPQTNQNQRIYSVFDANGLYQYRDQTCRGTGICSQNQGHGSFRAVPRGRQFFTMVNFSDLSRQSQCVSDDVSFPSPTTMVGRTSAVSRKQP
jgi:hypothetical protein